MDFNESKTHKNLSTAYLREAGAALEYYFYSEQARVDGYEQIANVLKTFGDNEKAHSKIWFKLFHNIADTEANLKDAKDLENYERTVLYAQFAKDAREEGFNDIAELFDGVSAIEQEHERTYKTLLEKVKSGCVFESQEEVTWQCGNCGHRHNGKTPPETCPVCSHPKAFFSILNQN